MRSSRLARFLTLLFAALQLAVLPVASVADARLERGIAAVQRGIGHVEDHGMPSCPAVHPADCACCQFLNGLASLARPRAVVPACTPAAAVHAAAPLGSPAADRVTLALPRGPPAS